MTRGKVLKIWISLFISYLLIVAILTMTPLLKTVINYILNQLDLMTYGIAVPTLLIFLSIGIGVTVYYLIVILRTTRGETSAIHIAASTMHVNMFEGNSEKRARETIANFKASPEPCVILLVPTDKRILNKFVEEVKG